MTKDLVILELEANAAGPSSYLAQKRCIVVFLDFKGQTFASVMASSNAVK